MDGEGQEESEQPPEDITSSTGSHSASFTVSIEEDAKIMEIRQRRLQRFHSSPAKTSSGTDDVTTTQTCLTGRETGLEGGGATSSEGSDGLEAAK